jgi:hypothetical protein
MGSLVEQMLLYLVQHFASPSWEPVLINYHVIRAMKKCVKAIGIHAPNNKQLKSARLVIAHIPNDAFSTSILKTHLQRILSALLRIQTRHRVTMKMLRSENGRLRNQNRMLQCEIDVKPTPNMVVLDGRHLTPTLRDAMTFFCMAA